MNHQNQKAIRYDEERQVFLLNTPHTSYAIGLMDGQLPAHLYYGKRIDSTVLPPVVQKERAPYTPLENPREKVNFLDSAPMEYPQTGMGDFREAALSVRNPEGQTGCELRYLRHEISPGKPPLQGLPATFGASDACSTLSLYCTDAVLKLRVCLRYTVFHQLDILTRSVVVENQGAEACYLDKVLSANLDMDNRDFEAIGLFGAWARERHLHRSPVGYGRYNIASLRGISSQQEHPFLALVTPETTQSQGEVYAMHFVYSGNFFAQAERSQYDQIRMQMGIHPDGFCWKLEPNTAFTAPEVVMYYGCEGLDAMTNQLHDLYRNHLIRSPYTHQKRPILVNNWEATYFDFDEKKLLSLAKEAKQLGIEMLVMDDGWFGRRESDNSSLGDWVVNEEKLKGGLSALVEHVKKEGLKFGIWMEPEMVSPDSDLFRAHPDWAIQLPGREISQSREQYVLDLSREEVAEAVYQMIYNLLRSADISYVKWDMNRPLTTIGSAALPADRQGELYHRYVLAVYRLQERMLTDFPTLLLENCSAGGARFDPGMLYYSPQIWTSDNTDAIARLAIQEGTAMLYPVSAMGAHVSVCPNHNTGRVTPFETRGDVAMLGTFGYELDLTKLSPADKALVREQTAAFHRYNDIVREGDYYRLASFGQTGTHDSWMVVGKDRKSALVFDVQVLAGANRRRRFLRLKGLNADACYRVNGADGYAGDVLTGVGLRILPEPGDFRSKIYLLEEMEP